MKLIESLACLGLNEKEAKVYLALLSLEKATAYTVATRSGLKKPTAYVILDNLVNKGFVLKVPSGDKTFFLAKSPKECIMIAKEKLSEVEERLPELLAIQKGIENKVNIAYYEGIDGIKEMYRGLVKNMKAKPEKDRHFIAFYAHQKDTPEVLQKYWPELNEEYRQIGLRREAITTLHPSTYHYLLDETKKRLNMDLRGLPENEYSSNVSIEAYDNYTIITSHQYVHSVLIENPDIASVIKQIFNLVWKTTQQK